MKLIKYTFLLLISYPLFSQQSFPENGVKSTFSPIYAFTNANIIISPEKQIHNGTLLIKEDKIIAVDSVINIPDGAIIKDLNGDFIYPSFIDLYSDYGIKPNQKGDYNYRPQFESKKIGAYHWNQLIHPEINTRVNSNIMKNKAEKYLKSGYGVVLSHKQDGISRGTRFSFII